MKKTCPACRAIEGHNPDDGALCDDCAKTAGVRTAYDGFWVMNTVKRTVVIYTFLFPLLMIASIAVVIIQKKGWGNLVGLLTPIGLWVFNVFWLWPKMKIPRWGKWDKMEDARDQIFIAKVAGEKE
jgi:hypothetical protein